MDNIAYIMELRRVDSYMELAYPKEYKELKKLEAKCYAMRTALEKKSLKKLNLK